MEVWCTQVRYTGAQCATRSPSLCPPPHADPSSYSLVQIQAKGPRKIEHSPRIRPFPDRNPISKKKPEPEVYALGYMPEPEVYALVLAAPRDPLLPTSCRPTRTPGCPLLRRMPQRPLLQTGPCGIMQVARLLPALVIAPLRPLQTGDISLLQFSIVWEITKLSIFWGSGNGNPKRPFPFDISYTCPSVV